MPFFIGTLGRPDRPLVPRHVAGRLKNYFANCLNNMRIFFLMVRVDAPNSVVKRDKGRLFKVLLDIRHSVYLPTRMLKTASSPTCINFAIMSGKYLW
jgi:hypothetical protein